MRLPTGSSLARAMACPKSVFLPVVKMEDDGKRGQRGTVLHKFLEDARNPSIGRDAALLAIDNDYWRAQAAAFDLDAIPAYWESEVAFEFDMNTGKVARIAMGKHRDYPNRPGCLYGTFDLVHYDDISQEVTVVDLKTGANLGDPGLSWQLKFGAVCMAFHNAGATSARVAYMYPNKDGGWLMEWATLNWADIKAAADQIRMWYERLLVNEEAKSDLSAGDHCRYCPAILACPAQTTMLRGLIGAMETMDEADLKALTPAQAGEAYLSLSHAKTLLKKIEAAFGHIVSNGPIPLPDGHHVKEVWTERLSLRPGAIAHIAKTHGEGAIPDSARCDISDLPIPMRQELRDAGLLGSVLTKHVRVVK